MKTRDTTLVDPHQTCQPLSLANLNHLMIYESKDQGHKIPTTMDNHSVPAKQNIFEYF
jgi:hypothetical protein